MTAALLPGAEPFSAAGGPHGVLVLHGLTGSPQSMRGLAQAFAGAGFTVELPLLPGHGRTIEDMEATGFADWLRAAEESYTELAGRVGDVIVAGLSMGGTLALTLAADHPEIIGLVLVNPLVDTPDEGFAEILRGMVADGETRLPGLGSDLADPDAHELTYDVTPVGPLLSLIEHAAGLPPCLSEIGAPILLFTSRQDHVVPTASSDTLVACAGGPVERVDLERSYHVATLDYDKGEVERRAVEFAAKLTTGATTA
jgi:carboxylesterase